VCRYYNGDFYEGTWADGVRNGIGMQQCTDGSNYVGQYKEAKREGYGVYTFHNGDCYLGTYKQDLPNGLGVYLFEKGQKYMGEWEGGKKHGLCAPLCCAHAQTAPPAGRQRHSHTSHSTQIARLHAGVSTSWRVESATWVSGRRESPSGCSPWASRTTPCQSSCQTCRAKCDKHSRCGAA
jgi:hypothetical protein